MDFPGTAALLVFGVAPAWTGLIAASAMDIEGLAPLPTCGGKAAQDTAALTTLTEGGSFLCQSCVDNGEETPNRPDR